MTTPSNGKHDKTDGTSGLVDVARTLLRLQERRTTQRAALAETDDQITLTQKTLTAMTADIAKGK